MNVSGFATDGCRGWRVARGLIFCRVMSCWASATESQLVTLYRLSSLRRRRRLLAGFTQQNKKWDTRLCHCGSRSVSRLLISWSNQPPESTALNSRRCCVFVVYEASWSLNCTSRNLWRVAVLLVRFPFHISLHFRSVCHWQPASKTSSQLWFTLSTVYLYIGSIMSDIFTLFLYLIHARLCVYCTASSLSLDAVVLWACISTALSGIHAGVLCCWETV